MGCTLREFGCRHGHISIHGFWINEEELSQESRACPTMETPNPGIGISAVSNVSIQRRIKAIRMLSQSHAGTSQLLTDSSPIETSLNHNQTPTISMAEKLTITQV